MAKNIIVGDQVRFMNEVGGGRVTAILSKDMVSVETQDGFEIPTYIKNLVVIEPDFQPKQSQRITPSASLASPISHSPHLPISHSPHLPISPSPRLPISPSPHLPISPSPRLPISPSSPPLFIFAALPDNPGNPPEGRIHLYLLNDSNFTLIYHFATKQAGLYSTVDAGMLEPDTKVELESILPNVTMVSGQSRGGELPEYCFQLLYFRKGATRLEEPLQKEIRISPVKLFKATSFVKNDYFNTPALLIKLSDHPLKAELEKLTEKDFQQVSLTKEPKKVVQAELPKTDLVEIDLHIHQLIDDTRGLSNADMLKLQLDTFRKEMDKAIASGVKKIVFIHGVGDGVLKNELRRELGRKYPKYPCQDASFREYGFGATMAVLRK